MFHRGFLVRWLLHLSTEERVRVSEGRTAAEPGTISDRLHTMDQQRQGFRRKVR
jgi:hypothetical protein